MAETRLFKAYVPEKDYDRLAKIFYNEMYSNDPKNALVYTTIKDNPMVPLGKLVWDLRKNHGVHRAVNGLKKIATLCGLPYTP